MNIVFEANFDAGTFPEPLAVRETVLDEVWTGPTGLLQIIETALGLGEPSNFHTGRAGALILVLWSVEEGFWIGSRASRDQRRILYVNPAFERIFGIRAEDVYASLQAWADIIHEEDRERVLAALDRFLRGAGGYDVEYRILRPDGAIRWVWARGFPIKDATGEERRTAGLAQDITERKQAEQALRESEERYRTILEEIEDGYYEVDLAGDFTFFNAALCRIFGYPAEARRGKGKGRWVRRDSAASDNEKRNRY